MRRRTDRSRLEHRHYRLARRCIRLRGRSKEKAMRRFLPVVAMALLLASCSRTPPEEALRRTIAQMQTAIEERDAGTLADGIAQDFIGPDGMDRKAAQRLAAVVFLQNRNIGVTLGPLDIKLRPGGAT